MKTEAEQDTSKVKLSKSSSVTNCTYTYASKDAFKSSLSKCYSNLSQLRAKISTINDPAPKREKHKSDLISEENEHMHITNNILNKTNVDLVNTLKELKVYREREGELKSKCQSLLEYNEYLKKKINSIEMENRNLSGYTQSAKGKVLGLEAENENLKKQIREMDNVIMTKEKFCNEVKQSFTAERSQIEKDNYYLAEELKKKDLIIEELSNKLKLSQEVNCNLQKNINDYENMATNLKNTIKILTEEGNNKKYKEMENIINERDIALKEKNDIISNLNRKIKQSEHDIVDKNTMINQLKSKINEMEKYSIENKEKSKKIENLNTKIDTLYKIISDKENVINQLNMNYDFINQTLLDIKNKNEEIANDTNSPMENLANIKNYLTELGQLINTASNRSKSNRSETKEPLKAERSQYPNDDLLSKVTELQKENANLQSQLVLNNSKQSERINQLLELNEKLSTENILLKNECDIANKKFNQILKDTSPDVIIPLSSITSTHNKIISSNKEEKENGVFLFRLYDNKRILRFDLSIHEYQIIELSDTDSFDDDIFIEGALYLNTLDGLFILCGKKFDTIYYYSNDTATISKIATLKYNHSHGAMVLDIANSSIFILSGWYNKKVEKYTNTSVICNETYSSEEAKEKLTEMKEMTIERSESSYLLMNGVLYAFFGYCYSKSEYIDTVECLDITKANDAWKVVKYKSKGKNFLLKSSGVLPINENEIFILGGFDGLKETSVEQLILFNMKEKCIEAVNKKLPDIVYNHCYNFGKESQFVSFGDDEGKIYMSNIDEMDNVHVIELPTLRYDLFKFD